MHSFASALPTTAMPGMAIWSKVLAGKLVR